MKMITFKVKNMPKTGIEVENLLPEKIAGKKIGDAKAIILYAGNKTMKAGDVFEACGQTAEKPEEQKIVFEGDLSKVKRIGERMSAGEIMVNGSVGYHVGERITGGTIIVAGDAGSWVGTDMKGGLIHVMGDCGSHVGCAVRGMSAGMSGGKIVVDGNVKAEVGCGMSGGEIKVTGRVDSFVGSYMSGGVITVGSVNIRPGYAMSGGKIIIEDIGFTPPFYFKKANEEDHYIVYEGDIGFKKRRSLFSGCL